MAAITDLDHVALAARDTTPLLHFLTGTLNATVLFGGNNVGFRPMQVLVGDVDSGMKVELLEPWEAERNDFLARFLDARGAGPHHLTFKVPDINVALDRARALDYEPVNINVSHPMWKEAFIHPRQSHGTVVQLAESHGEWGSRAELLESVAANPGQGAPRWWADPLPPSGPPTHLRRVVIGVPALAAATAMYRDLLDGTIVPDEHDTTSENGGEHSAACELAWPGGGRVRLVARPGRAAVDRLEVAGISEVYDVLGTRFAPG